MTTDPIITDPWAQWLTQRQRHILHLPNYRAAAVLVALTLEDDPRVLLTVRSGDMPTHKGQISFPGGGLKAGESPVQAALREAWEEVGLESSALTVLGELDDVFSPAGFHVTPVLARLHDPNHLSPSHEVSELLWPRLSELRGLAQPHLQRQDPDGTPFTLYRYPWQAPNGTLHNIWGMTARVLHELLEP